MTTTGSRRSSLTAHRCKTVPELTEATLISMYVGHVNFADGMWIGVELDRKGKKKKDDNDEILHCL